MLKLEEKSVELESNFSHLVVALEGLAGGGKTHVANCVKETLIAQGQPAELFKFSGLGDEVKWLQDIRSFREQIYQSQQETEQQRLDRESDRIYHLAAVKQTRIIVKAMKNLPNQAVIILDRTPFVGFAYAKARDPNSQLLEVIYAQNLEVARRIPIDRVILFDLSPEESYARTFARYYLYQPNQPELINQAIERIQAPANAAETIRQRTFALINSGVIKPKKLENWHFPSFEFTKAHRETFKEALLRGQKDLGFDLITVNADHPLETVISDTLAGINQIRQGIMHS